jgi:glucosamine--fructose-6-phosphate aminotransferase (isomerizing)
VVACSQSGQSADLIEALDLLRPKELIALTNAPGSPLGLRADVVIDIGAGPEIAVPASKTVTSMAAILLWAAGLIADAHSRNDRTLIETAEDVRGWLDGGGVEAIRAAGERIARRRSVVVLAAGYGVPVANECALKLKEASYIHAEGFSAGEFRHGSAAMLDASCAIIGIVDEHARGIVNRPLREALEAESLRFVFGERLSDIPLLGPVVGIAFNTLGWLVAGQMLALYIGRARHVDPDAPRGLTKALV